MHAIFLRKGSAVKYVICYKGVEKQERDVTFG